MGLTTDPTDTALYEYSNGIIGTILGLFAAGAFFGAIFAGWYCDAYGRKKLLSKLPLTHCKADRIDRSH
jgi:MFS family permease